MGVRSHQVGRERREGVGVRSQQVGSTLEVPVTFTSALWTSHSRVTTWNCSGSLLTRNLGDLVKKEDFVLDSEYLITLLVVVPK